MWGKVLDPAYRRGGGGRPQHNCCYICTVIILCIVALITYIVLLVGFLAGNDTLDLCDLPPCDPDPPFVNDTPVRPAMEIFFINWFLIFLYSIVFLGYVTSTLFRRSRVTGEFLYMVAPFIPIHVLICYAVAFGLLIVWAFVITADDLLLESEIVLYIVFVTITAAFCYQIYAIYKYYPELNAAGFKIEDRLVVGICINSIGIIVTWVFLLATTTIPNVLVEESDFEPDLAASVGLAVNLIFYGVYVCLDLGCDEKFFRFVYGPHIPFLTVSIGIVARNFDADNVLSPLTVGWTIVVIVVIICKITLDCTRENLRPRFGTARLESEGRTLVEPGPGFVNKVALSHSLSSFPAVL